MGIYGWGLGRDVKISLGDRDYFRQLRDDPHAELVASAPLVGRYVGKWAIILARRINRPDGGAKLRHGRSILAQYLACFLAAPQLR
jgi:hypothetical protein